MAVPSIPYEFSNNESTGRAAFHNANHDAWYDALTDGTANLTVGTITAEFLFETEVGITASTTQTQGNGALTENFNEITTCANDNDTVTMPAARAGSLVWIVNNGAKDLQVFPASGDNFEGLAANASITMCDDTATDSKGIHTLAWAQDSTTWQYLSNIVTGYPKVEPGLNNYRIALWDDLSRNSLTELNKENSYAGFYIYRSGPTVGTILYFNDDTSGGMGDDPVEIQINNTSLTHSGARARLSLTTGGPNGGDPMVKLGITNTVWWSIGLDNSDNDYFKINPGQLVATVDLFTITPTGAICANNYSDNPGFWAYGDGKPGDANTEYLRMWHTGNGAFFESGETGTGTATSIYFGVGAAGCASSDPTLVLHEAGAEARKRLVVGGTGGTAKCLIMPGNGVTDGLEVYNVNSSSNSHARLRLQTHNSYTSNDPFILWTIANVGDLFSMGVDNSDSDIFGLWYNDTPGTNPVFTVDGSQNLTFGQFPITPSAAPTTDYQTSNKKYVDDQIAANVVTINNNTDNNLLTASGTANTINGETTLTYNSNDTLTIDGAADAQRLILQAHSTQTANILEIQNSSGSTILQHYLSSNNSIISINSGGTNAQSGFLTITYNDQIAYPSTATFAKSHNDTIGGMTTTIDTEVLGVFTFKGVGTTNAFAHGAQISCTQDGAASGAAFVPAGLIFKTSNGTAYNNIITCNANNTLNLNAATTCDSTLNCQNTVTIENTNSLVLNADGTGEDIQIWNNSIYDNWAYFAVYPESGTNVASYIMIIPKGSGTGAFDAGVWIFGTDYNADATNYEGMRIGPVSDVHTIDVRKGGTGTQRSLALSINGTAVITIDASGNFQINSDQIQDSGGSDAITFDGSQNTTFAGEIKPATLADAAASNNSIYYSSTQSKLVYKDGGGTVNNLY